ncbi:glycosyltransferase [Massilia sp. CCM 9210]|uniref:glycosyltransferase n=1 Tax=Massilia scottii TaxID=3057166 RepID=UPI002796D2F5|nr:glycosyltransferase [Massilia sp. CCM 9210]MDQ1815240.1 glycosyltransferase [Massilia sp. CCM 9210]
MKIFAICYYAPPKLTPQAIQIGRQLYHLDARVELLHGSDPQFSDAYDQYPDFFERIGSLCVPSPGTFFQGFLHKVARRLLPLYNTIPDGLGPWRRRALAPALERIAASGSEALVSFGMPMSDHLLALELKRRTGLPWLAHFSDPWSDNPFHPNTWLEHRVNAALERRVIGAADRVLFTSQRTLELVMAKYPPAWRARAAVLPHAWDMDNFAGPAPALDPAPAAPAPARPGVRHVVRHIGACYGARSPEPLFAALARIAERQPAALEAVAFEFVGHVSPNLLASDAYKALPAGLVRMRGQVGYRESLQLARDSDALLVIDAPSKLPSVFLPSKLVEYIGARRPVWGITPPGTSADLIAEWAGSADACAAPDDIEAVTRMLRAGLAALDGAARQGGPEAVAERFAAPRVAAALKAQIALAIGRGAA